MTQPPVIHDAMTTDGVRIAYHTLGDGPLVVMLFPYHVNHLRLNWGVERHRRGMEFLARYFTVVNLDLRGAGMSERGVRGLSLDAFVEDIDAVLEPFKAKSVAFCAMGPAAATACRFAAAHPLRVAGIVFVSGGHSDANRHLLELRRLNPSLEARIRGALLGGDDDFETAASLAAVARDALDADALREWEQLFRETRLAELAPTVTAPCLCVHAADDDLVPIAAGRAFADCLPHSTFMPVPVSTGMQIWRDRGTLRAIALFLADRLAVDSSAIRRGGQRGLGDHFAAGLSAREVEVLRLIAAGSTNRQIAAALCISPNTVSHHLRNIFAKTATGNRTEAAAFAHRWVLEDRAATRSKLHG
jgi:DNA-binding CsgD family transcriptional regulator/pimeloyl-ACP methyl ester carboxylesterase